MHRKEEAYRTANSPGMTVVYKAIKISEKEQLVDISMIQQIVAEQW